MFVKLCPDYDKNSQVGNHKYVFYCPVLYFMCSKMSSLPKVQTIKLHECNTESAYTCQAQSARGINCLVLSLLSSHQLLTLRHTTKTEPLSRKWQYLFYKKTRHIALTILNRFISRKLLLISLLLLIMHHLHHYVVSTSLLPLLRNESNPRHFHLVCPTTKQ